MPELPEVETVRRGLERTTADFTIDKVDVLRERAIASPIDPLVFRLGLQGCRPGPWRRRGKYLLAPLEHPGGEPGGTWGVHLRMTGQFLWLETPAPPCRHTRVRVRGEDGRELRFVDPRSFGQMWWVPPGTPPEAAIPALATLGPEPLGEAFTITHLRQALAGSRRAIKSALLDQTLVAGVGNIYADEALFLAGIRPATPAGRLNGRSIEALRAALVEVLETSIGAGGTTFRDFRDLTGRNGNYGGQAWVYRRHGEPCRRCGAPIQRERLAGRSSHWCAHCQR